MNKEDEILKNHIKDLANRCYQNNMYTFTDFLSLADVNVYYSIEREINFVQATLFGGLDSCERKIIRFGSAEQLGYEEEFPITILKIKPLMAKFSDELTHRDVLGALMNLGIERSVLGDILLHGKEVYLFCLSSIAEFICEKLIRIKHTSVMCEVAESVPMPDEAEKIRKVIQIQSERIDGVVAKVYNMSRSRCALLFTERRIFVNGRLNENHSYQLKSGDVITVRGMGRFTYLGAGGMSRKGKLCATIEV